LDQKQLIGSLRCYFLYRIRFYGYYLPLVWLWVDGLIGNAVSHISQPPEFKSRSEHIWRVSHLWLRLITSEDRSVHLAYFVHISGRKTSNKQLPVSNPPINNSTRYIGFFKVCFCVSDDSTIRRKTDIKELVLT